MDNNWKLKRNTKDNSVLCMYTGMFSQRKESYEKDVLIKKIK